MEPTGTTQSRAELLMDRISMDTTQWLTHMEPMQRGWDPEKRKVIGERIAWARELVVPSRRQFAREIGVQPSTIMRIENGKKGPSIALLQRICHELRISTDYVIDGKLVGVDPELSQKLIVYHPELLRVQPDTAGKVFRDGTSHRPRKPMASMGSAASG